VPVIQLFDQDCFLSLGNCCAGVGQGCCRKKSSLEESYPSFAKVVKEHKANASSSRAPKPTDRVAIIGAGPAGVSMASYLIAKGFQSKQITIFESSDRVGGKSCTVHHPDPVNPSRTIPTDLGAFNLGVGYPHVEALWAKYGAKESDYSYEMDRMVYNLKNEAEGTLEDYIYGQVKTVGCCAKKSQEEVQLYEGVVRYLRIYKSIFGNSPYYFQAELPQDKLEPLLIPFSEWIKKNHFEVLLPFLTFAITSQGYGSLDSISTIQAMWWISPKVLAGVIQPKRHPVTKEPILSWFFRPGWQVMWERILKKENIQVIFNAQVTSILRKKEDAKQEEDEKEKKRTQY